MRNSPNAIALVASVGLPLVIMSTDWNTCINAAVRGMFRRNRIVPYMRITIRKKRISCNLGLRGMRFLYTS